MILQKAKNYALLTFALFTLTLAFQNYLQKKSIERKDKEIARLDFNSSQLLDESKQNTYLYLTQKEVTGKLLRERDSLAAALKVKPKQIEKIIYLTNTVHDTVPVPVFIEKESPNFWKVTDKGDCFIWKADVHLKDDTLQIIRTLFDYQNKTTQTFYRDRPHKFLCIKFGKWRNLQQIEAECGGVVVKTFEFSK